MLARRALFPVLFGRRSSAAVIPWYLSGGIDPASCVAAWDSRAASYAASKANRANPGTYDLTDPAGAVPWSSGEWGVFNTSGRYFSTGVIINSNAWGVIVVTKSITASSYVCGVQGSGETTVRISARDDVDTQSAAYGSNTYLAYSNATLLASSPSVWALTAGKAIINNSVVESWSFGYTSITRPLYFGGLNNGGSVGSPLAGKIVAAAIYNPGPSAVQVAAIAATFGVV